MPDFYELDRITETAVSLRVALAESRAYLQAIRRVVEAREGAAPEVETPKGRLTQASVAPSGQTRHSPGTVPEPSSPAAVIGPSALLEEGEVRQDIPIDQVRYVRAAVAPDKSARSAIDLITRDENIRWLFHAGIGNAVQVEALAAVLAESMTIPDVERDALQRRRHIPIE
ncbi:hypothetical protein [Streptomyces mutabilis]|uniref:hypothetical protein n=1 Tax=Streptomyces mutabilis TaxID=67332 RepID=UPI0034DE3178